MINEFEKRRVCVALTDGKFRKASQSPTFCTSWPEYNLKGKFFLKFYPIYRNVVLLFYFIFFLFLVHYLLEK